jgi:hypothetical protein
LDFQGILKGGWGRLMVNVSKKSQQKKSFCATPQRFALTSD